MYVESLTHIGHILASIYELYIESIFTRILIVFLLLSLSFVSFHWFIGEFVVDRYKLTFPKDQEFEELGSLNTQTVRPILSTLNSFCGSDSNSEAEDTILDHISFYKRLNNSSQYLRRDSFSQ